YPLPEWVFSAVVLLMYPVAVLLLCRRNCLSWVRHHHCQNLNHSRMYLCHRHLLRIFVCGVCDRLLRSSEREKRKSQRERLCLFSVQKPGDEKSDREQHNHYFFDF